VQCSGIEMVRRLKGGHALGVWTYIMCMMECAAEFSSLDNWD
jgi:hypothetical protein